VTTVETEQSVVWTTNPGDSVLADNQFALEFRKRWVELSIPAQFERGARLLRAIKAREVHNVQVDYDPQGHLRLTSEGDLDALGAFLGQPWVQGVVRSANEPDVDATPAVDSAVRALMQDRHPTWTAAS
jgi:hypothetical protein